MSERQLSFGEKACGVSLNPSGDPAVTSLKGLFAEVVDMLHNLRLANENDPEVKRMLSIAITEVQGAQMWAVKAVTWKS